MFKLEQSTIRSVCSGQVITSPYSIVKELVENSIDAGATIVDVRLEDFGLTKIEVRDNGCGIPADQRSLVVMPHFTSKLQQFDDISQLSTYGYRGEALSAICTVASVAMTTKHQSDSVASSYQFDSDGNLTMKNTSHQNTGTTFIVTELFKNLPVRKNYYKGRKGKEQLDTISAYLKGMCIANCKVRHMLRHNKQLLWQHSSSTQLKKSLGSVYGSVGDMIHFSLVDGDSQIEGMLTSVVKSTREPPFYIINKRLVKFKAASKLLKKLYVSGYPHGAIIITIHPSDIDVNVEVDKSAVICKNEKLLLTMIESEIGENVLMLSNQVDAADVSHDFYEANVLSQTQYTANEDSIITEDIGMSSNIQGVNKSSVPADTNSATVPNSEVTTNDNHLTADMIRLGSNENKTCEQNTEKQISLFTSKMHSYDQNEVLDKIITSPKKTIIGEDASQSTSMSIWDALEKELGSDEDLNMEFGPDTELFSPDKTTSPLIPSSIPNTFEKQQLSNIINVEEPQKTDKSQKKQTSIISWSQGNSDFKLDFISPEPPKTPARITPKTSCNKKRGMSVSPVQNAPEKRRKTLTSPVPKPSKNSLKFSLKSIKSTLSRKHNTKLDASSQPAQAFEVDNKWFMFWHGQIFAFNPTRAQEVNIYNKLMSSHSLKYGHNLQPPYQLHLSDIGCDVFTFLIKCPTTYNDMEDMTYVKHAALAVNGIRIRKQHDGCFLVTNVCDVVDDFCKDDVVETLRLIEEHHSMTDDSNVVICEFKQVRCSKVCGYFCRKAQAMSCSFASFKPTVVDVIDLFSNTIASGTCVHGNKVRLPIWDLNSNTGVVQ